MCMYRFWTDPLPTSCCNISLSVTNNTCYAIGGYDGSVLNQALYAPIDDLFSHAVPAIVNQTTPSDSSGTQSAWKTLPNTPTWFPVAGVLAAGSLFALGGRKTPERRADKKEIYVYSCSSSEVFHTFLLLYIILHEHCGFHEWFWHNNIVESDYSTSTNECMMRSS